MSPTETPAATAGTLRVRRHDVVLRVPRAGAPEGGHHRLDQLCGSALTDRLASELDSFSSTGVWLVRRLDVHVTVGGSWPVDRTGLAVAHAVTAAVRRAVTEDDDRSNVVWFQDLATFLACFLIDVAEGRATDRWEYRHLLREHQSRSATILAELARSPSMSLDALRQMSPGQRFAVVSALSPDDAHTALRAIASTPADGNHDAFADLANVTRELIESSRLPAEPNGAALAIFIAAVDRRRVSASPWAAERATEVAALIDVLRKARTSERGDLADAIAQGAWSAIGRSQLSGLAGLATWPLEHRRAAVAAALPDCDSSAGTAPREGEMSTGLGGMFLLLPILDEFPLDLTATWPDLNGISPPRVARFLLMVSALGAPRNAATAADAVLRLAVGIPSRLTCNEISQWINQRTAAELDALLVGVGSFLERQGVQRGAIVPSTLDEHYAAVGPPFAMARQAANIVGMAGAALVRALAGRLPGLAKSSLPYIWTNILDFDATVAIGQEQYVVSLSDPPLHLLLSMVGLNQQRFMLEGQEGYEWVLTRAA